MCSLEPSELLCVENYFPLSLCTNVGVSHNRQSSKLDWLSSLPRVQGLLYLANPPSAFLSQRILTINPLTRHITVTTQVCSRSTYASVGVVSASPKSVGVMSLTFFPIPLLFFFLCTMDSFMLSRTKVTKWYLSSSVLFLSRAHPIFFTGPVHGDFIPHISTIVPPPLVLPSCLTFAITFHHFCLQGVPPSRASPPADLFQGVDRCIGFLITGPSHGSPHTFCNPFKQEGQAHLYPYLPGHLGRSCTIGNPCSFFVSFRSELTHIL